MATTAYSLAAWEHTPFAIVNCASILYWYSWISCAALVCTDIHQCLVNPYSGLVFFNILWIPIQYSYSSTSYESLLSTLILQHLMNPYFILVFLTSVSCESLVFTGIHQRLMNPYFILLFFNILWIPILYWFSSLLYLVNP